MPSHPPHAPTTGATPPHRRLGRAIRLAAWLGVSLHTVGVLWIWLDWPAGLGASWVVWMDLPASLLYLGARDGWFLGLSLVVGGCQWALWGALVSAGLGRLARQHPETG